MQENKQSGHARAHDAEIAAIDNRKMECRSQNVVDGDERMERPGGGQLNVM